MTSEAIEKDSSVNRDDADSIKPLTQDEKLARGLYGDRALAGPNALSRSIKDWG